MIIHSHAPCSGVRSLRRDYPSQADAGLAFTLALERVCVKGFEVKMDDAAHADMERAAEAARAHAAAVLSAAQSAGGTATMAGPYAARIQSAGGKTGAGGKAQLGKIYKKPKQTAAQQAKAENMRKYRAAKRAAESIVRVE